jgi:hypothetical protein
MRLISYSGFPNPIWNYTKMVGTNKAHAAAPKRGKKRSTLTQPKSLPAAVRGKARHSKKYGLNGK